MNNKIIKTLNSIKSYINQYENEGGDLSIPFDKWKLLLDYITNLQEESKKLNDIIETLKETNNLLINQKYKLEYELDMLDNKRDKAIEWVKKNMYYFPRPNELLDLLQGENNE